MSGPKRAPGHFRQPRGWKGNTYGDPYLVLPLVFAAGIYLIGKYVGQWQWMDRIASASWASIKDFPLWS